MGGGANELPAIDLVVCAIERDAPLLPHAIDAARRTVANPIRSVWVVTPDEQVEAATAWCTGHTVVGESSVIPDHLIEMTRDHIRRDRVGWAVQQLAKFLMVLHSDAPACLVLDADTMLVRRRTWLGADGVQLLVPSLEYHRTYALHAARVWPHTELARGVSFVTHHQLMQRDIVIEMFGADGSGLGDWLAAADSSATSAISEFHCYGSHLVASHPERVRLGRFHNVALPRSEFEGRVVHGSFGASDGTTRRDPCSISFHHYLTDDAPPS